MFSPRWRKLWGDLRAERGRLTLMVAAISVSLLAVLVVLGSWAVLRREMAVNYLGTRPAAATLELEENVDQELLATVRSLPNVADAGSREVIRARVRVGADWRPLLVFVADDFDDLRVSRFYRVKGAWPPPVGTVLLERSAVAMAKATIGDELLVMAPTGTTATLSVSGLSHDPGLAPAWQERSVYAFATRGTLAQLNMQPTLHEVRVTFRESFARNRGVEAAADALSRELLERGIHVTEIRVPPLNEHPHQRQMTTILVMLLIFAGLALILSSVLVATSLAAILARQVREIGVMKTLGATTRQLARMYASSIVAMGIASLVFAVPGGALGARYFSHTVATMLNFDITDPSIPGWVLACVCAAGLIVPVAIAAIPISRATRLSVRAALDQFGAANVVPDAFRRIPVPLRNAMRRPARFALTVGLLATGGALFMTSLAVSKSWDKNVDKIYESRLYDVEVRLHATASSALVDQLRSSSEIRAVEVWDYASAAFGRPGQVDLVHTYPDRGHGSFSVMAPPAATKLVNFPLLAGRWLTSSDEDGVVLNHVAAAQSPTRRIGDEVALSVAGHVSRMRLIGIVEEVGAPGVAYVTHRGFTRFAREQAQGRLLRLATHGKSSQDRTRAVAAVERALALQHVGVESVTPFSELRTAVGDHIVVLTRALVSMAAVLALVGVLGLGSAMGISVVERTREIGVMKAVGATSRRIVAVIVAEAFATAIVSYFVALSLSLPLTWLVLGVIGRIGFLAPLPFVVAPKAVFVWGALLGISSIVATLVPAYRAARMSVQSALAVTA